MDAASIDRASKAVDGYWMLLIFTGLWTFVTIPVALILIFSHPATANRCQVSLSGEMVADKTIDGILVRSSSWILARQYDGTKYKQKFLAGCGGRGACRGPYQELEKHIGEPVHADFCGSSLIRVDVSGSPIFRDFPPSQKYLNDANAENKVLGYLFILIALVLVTLSVVGIRRRRAADTSKSAQIISQKNSRPV